MSINTADSGRTWSSALAIARKCNQKRKLHDEIFDMLRKHVTVQNETRGLGSQDEGVHVVGLKPGAKDLGFLFVI